MANSGGPATPTRVQRVRSSTGNASASRARCPDRDYVQGKLEITKVCEPDQGQRRQRGPLRRDRERTPVARPLENVNGRGRRTRPGIKPDEPEHGQPSARSCPPVTVAARSSSRARPTKLRAPTRTSSAARPRACQPVQARAARSRSSKCEPATWSSIGPAEDLLRRRRPTSRCKRRQQRRRRCRRLYRSHVQYGGCLGGGFQDFNIGPLAPGEDWTHDWSMPAIAGWPLPRSVADSRAAAHAVRSRSDAGRPRDGPARASRWR